MDESDQSIRSALLSTLAFLASAEEQRGFAQKVEYEDYEGEFACWWFDEFYPDEPRALAMFTSGQLAALREFSAVFEACHTSLAHESFSIDQLLANSEWRAVIARARETLDRIEHAP
jgi:hypothetical protein